MILIIIVVALMAYTTLVLLLMEANINYLQEQVDNIYNKLWGSNIDAKTFERIKRTYKGKRNRPS